MTNMDPVLRNLFTVFYLLCLGWSSLCWDRKEFPGRKLGPSWGSLCISLPFLRPALTVVHFLNTVASYILAGFILVLGTITNLVLDTLLWLEADQSWIFISKQSRRNFKGLMWTFLFYIVFFITYRAYFIKSFTGRLEFFLKLYVEHIGLCGGGAFLFLISIDGLILYIVRMSLKYFTGYLRFSICNNQNMVVKCYDLHPPNPGNLACRPQEGSFNSLTLCIWHWIMWDMALTLGKVTCYKRMFLNYNI